jgi:hypothetical protein
MRPLTEPETKVVFDKLANYCTDLKSLIAPLDDGDRYVFRLNHSRVRIPLGFPQPMMNSTSHFQSHGGTIASIKQLTAPL